MTTWRHLFNAFVLAGLAPMLVVGFYYRPALQHGLTALPADNDCVFYVYQLVRAHEVGGRWWELGNDAKIGVPFDSAAKLHPGLYEGIDAILLSALIPADVPHELRYHLIVGFFLALNGWVASGLVYARTKSLYFAGLAAVLIIVALPIAIRMRVHLHLVKHAYCLLAIWAFFGCLDRPTLRRGMLLGLTLFLVLQGSFYLAYLLTLGLIGYGGGWLLRGKMTQPHFRAFASGAVVLLGLAIPATIPLWRPSSGKLDEAYVKRSPVEAWHNSAEIWQYLLAPSSRLQKMPEFNWGGVNYPGDLILVTLFGCGIVGLRGKRAAPPFSRDPKCTHEGERGVAEPPAPPTSAQLLLLAGILVLVSLRGGPNLIVATVAKSFRCYDRAGAIAVAICCVAMPIVLHGASVWICARKRVLEGEHSATGVPFASRLNGITSRLNGFASWLNVVFLALVGGAAFRDALTVRTILRNMPTAAVHPATAVPRTRAEFVPGWVFWLADQPANVKLIALPKQTPGDSGYFADAWNFDSLYYRTLHQHSTLNGCSFRQLEAHLKDQGCAYATMTPKGLRSLVDLGYNRVALADNFIAAFPWAREQKWLELEKGMTGWTIYRVRD